MASADARRAAIDFLNAVAGASGWQVADGTPYTAEVSVNSLAALLDARERPLLAQVAALRDALVEIRANGWCPCVKFAEKALAKEKP